MTYPLRIRVRIDKCNELQETLDFACLDYGSEFYQGLLDEWTDYMQSIMGECHVVKHNEIVDKWLNIQSRLPDVSDEEFDMFCMLGDLLARMREGRISE